MRKWYIRDDKLFQMKLDSRKRSDNDNDENGYQLDGENFEENPKSVTLEKSNGLWPNPDQRALFILIEGTITGAKPGYDYKFQTIIGDVWGNR